VRGTQTGDERAYPLAVCERDATKPESLFRENPLGGGSFARGLRWLGPDNPLRGCSDLAASPPSKIPRRRIAEPKLTDRDGENAEAESSLDCARDCRGAASGI